MPTRLQWTIFFNIASTTALALFLVICFTPAVVHVATAWGLFQILLSALNAVRDANANAVRRATQVDVGNAP